MATTGNAGGSHNLVVAHGDDDLAGAAARAWAAGFSSPSSWGRASIRVTGDFSRGAAGFWVEDGVDRLPGRGDHHRRQPARHVPRHRRDRQRRRSPRLAPRGLDPDRPHDGRGPTEPRPMQHATTRRRDDRADASRGSARSPIRCAAPSTPRAGSRSCRPATPSRCRRKRSSSSRVSRRAHAKSGPARSRRCCASTRASSRSSRSSRSSTARTTRRARASSRGCGTRCSISSRRSSPRIRSR